jgi:hypothetical protein
MLDTLEDVEIVLDQKITDDGDHDRYQHYFSKRAIEANIFHGTPMTALCGKVLLRQVDPKGRTICQTCIDEYEKLEKD